jgi:hypothetical protein
MNIRNHGHVASRFLPLIEVVPTPAIGIEVVPTPAPP